MTIKFIRSSHLWMCFCFWSVLSVPGLAQHAPTIVASDITKWAYSISDDSRFFLLHSEDGDEIRFEPMSIGNIPIVGPANQIQVGSIRYDIQRLRFAKNLSSAELTDKKVFDGALVNIGQGPTGILYRIDLHIVAEGVTNALILWQEVLAKPARSTGCSVRIIECDSVSTRAQSAVQGGMFGSPSVVGQARSEVSTLKQQQPLPSPSPNPPVDSKHLPPAIP